LHLRIILVRILWQFALADPQVASVGLTEEGARSLKINVRAVDYEIDTLKGANLHTDEMPLEAIWHAVPSFPMMSEVWLHLLENYGL
jgi:pyruvate/2-oxoglutarate dehydrogenase complex dihydrolipoamide dehydrogenase (E3) component